MKYVIRKQEINLDSVALQHIVSKTRITWCASWESAYNSQRLFIQCLHGVINNSEDDDVILSNKRVIFAATAIGSNSNIEAEQKILNICM